MKNRLKLLSPVLVVASLVIIASCLLIYERETLWKVQEMNLFLDTPLFLKQQMVTSGWLLTWLGCWFTEFFYVPWLGVTLLTLWWAVLLLVLWRAFRIPVQWLAVLLIPLAAIVIMNVDVGYWVYYLKLRGHFFAATIGTTLAVSAVWLFRIITKVTNLSPLSSFLSPLSPILPPPSSLLSPLYIFLATGLLYPLIGFYGLLAALLMGVLGLGGVGVLGCGGTSLTSRIVTLVVAVLSIVFWPLLCYNYVFCQTGIAHIWWTGLPLFTVDRDLPNYYIPYYVLVASLLLLALMYGKWPSLKHQPSSLKHQPSSIKHLTSYILLHAVIVVAAVFCVHHFWYKDYNFHKELRMQQCLEQQDWEGVLAQEQYDDEEPTRAIIMMRNLALFRLGRQGDEMYRYKDGSKPCDTPVPIRMMQVAGYSMYYNYGLANFCHRWCLEQGVEFGFRAEYLKYMMRCALVNGEWQEARKYVALLKHTRYHKAWAERYERFIGHPDKLKADAEFSPICHLMTSDDVLGSDQMLAEDFIMRRFLRSTSDDPLYKEQSLLAALWVKDIPTFWTRFSDYVRSHPGIHIPTHYQEAAYLYGHLQEGVDISHMPFDAQVKQDYEAFMDLANNATSTSEDEMRPIFYQRFGHTFYYNYFFIHELPLY